MITIDEMQEMLEDIVSEFPKEFFKELNGGILLLEEAKLDPKSVRNDLYIMGQYHRGGSMGRYISIYYGSFQKLYGHFSEEKIRKRLRETVKHEFTHHLESLAGERSLEREDEIFMMNYLNKHKSDK
ncbi:MAG TPA: hypothetical protein DHN33_08460 [Eubacteriaceae bacterium]|nr:hypothetical protein [Eubacteriaceae bacterium]